MIIGYLDKGQYLRDIAKQAVELDEVLFAIAKHCCLVLSQIEHTTLL